MLLPDHKILDKGLIKGGPSTLYKGKMGGTSWGYSSYSYDLRLSNKFAVMKKPNLLQKFMQWLLLDSCIYKYTFKDKRGDQDNRLWSWLFGAIDVTCISHKIWTSITSDTFIIKPNSYVLAVSEEFIELPNGLTGFVVDKSTLARLGLTLQNTILNSGWGGPNGSSVTLEIANHGERPVILTSGMGICSVLFITGENCRNTYQGMYQNQVEEVTFPKRAT